MTSTQPPAPCAAAKASTSTGVCETTFSSALVVPDVVLARGDVEVADEDGALGRGRGEPGAELGEEVELVGELRVQARVGDVAAGGDVEVVDHRARGQAGGDVAGVAAGAEVAVRDLLERQAREDGDAVVGLLAADDDVGVAEGAEAVERELLDRGLGLLEAEDVGRLLAQEAQHGRLAVADRVDVPGGDADGHGGSGRDGRVGSGVATSRRRGLRPRAARPEGARCAHVCVACAERGPG